MWRCVYLCVSHVLRRWMCRLLNNRHLPQRRRFDSHCLCCPSDAAEDKNEEDLHQPASGGASCCKCGGVAFFKINGQ